MKRNLILFFAAALLCSYFAPSYGQRVKEEKKPIYFNFNAHYCGPYLKGAVGPYGNFHPLDEPVPISIDIKFRMDLYEKYGFKEEMGFTFTVLEQLLEDYPETVEQIKRLKMPIYYHGGPGHHKPNPNGFQRVVDTEGMSPEEAWRETIRASWEFETHRLIPDWHWEGKRVVWGNARSGEPIADEFGGWLAIQNILGVTLLDSGRESDVFKLLGSGSYEYKSPVPDNAVGLPTLNELYFYGSQSGIPPKYYGKKIAWEAPMTADPVKWLTAIRDNFPRNVPYYQGTMLHGGSAVGETSQRQFEAVARFLYDNQDDFKVAWRDMEAAQWEPENRPLEFYKKTFGVNSLKEMLDVPFDVVLEKVRKAGGGPRAETRAASRRTSPYETVRDTEPVWKKPRKGTFGEKVIKAETLLKAADYIISKWPRGSHDADFGGPPDYIELGKEDLSLADAFQGFCFALKYYVDDIKLPESVTITDVKGPIDFPTYKLEKQPYFDDRKRTGYNPSELDVKYFPDPEIVEAQGLPSCGDYHIWMPVHTIADEEDVFYAAYKSAEKIKLYGHIPGVVKIPLLREDSRNERVKQKRLFKVNPAEFLYALAQEYRVLYVVGSPGPVIMTSMKLIKDQVCKLIMPSTPFYHYGTMIGEWTQLEGFIWRAYLSPEDINAAWTYIPK